MKRWLWVGVAVAIGGGAYGAYAIFVDGEELERVEVGDAPVQLQFESEQATVVELWSGISIRVRTESGGYADIWVDRMPHFFDYEIEVEHGDGSLGTMTCNPLRHEHTASVGSYGDPDDMLSSSSHRLDYFGRMKDCRLPVDAGVPITLTVRRVWHDESARPDLFESLLAVKLPGML